MHTYNPPIPPLCPHHFFPSRFVCSHYFLLALPVCAWRTIYRSLGGSSGAACLKKTEPPFPTFSFQELLTTRKGEFTSSSCTETVILPGLIMYREHACSHSSSEFMSTMALLCPASTVSVQTSPTSASYSLSAPSSATTAVPWERGSDTDIPLRAVHTTVSHSLGLSQFRSLYYSPR